MLRILQCALCIIVLLVIGSNCEGRDWRGIVPLHSTKNDVRRLLGPPAETNDIRSVYHLQNEHVYIVFSGKQHCNFETTRIPVGTVLLVQVSPRAKLQFSDLQIDWKKLREFKPSSQDPDWKGFIDEEEGLIVRNYKDTIDRLFYVAAAKDRVRCPGYYAELEEFARIYISFNSRPFDEYSNLAFADEMARLDNFAIYLQKDQPTWRAYIVAYSSVDAVADARARGERAKQYLLKLGLSENRIMTIVGGAAR